MASPAKSVKLGQIYLDELNTLKVLQPEQQTHTQNLQQACLDYISQNDSFKKATSDFIAINENKAKKVETTRLKSVGLNCITNQVDILAENDVNIHTNRIKELTEELDRLQLTLNSLNNIEVETQRQIDILTSQ